MKIVCHTLLLVKLCAETATGFVLPPLPLVQKKLYTLRNLEQQQQPDYYRMAKNTYGSSSEITRDLVKLENVMNDFFLYRYDWQPLFRSLVADSSVPAMTLLGHIQHDTVDLDLKEVPWKTLDAIPSDTEDKSVLAGFLDAMQQALVDIPVTDSEKDDEYDVKFIEEGRRMLCISRFHVIRYDGSAEAALYDSLFGTCWNELAELSKNNQPNTGSLIVLHGDILREQDLYEFTQTQVQQPLSWIGLAQDFEISSIVRGSLPAVRILHKLTAPTVAED